MPDEFGPQPLDQILEARGLTNSDLVRVSGEQLTHKQVQKARTGRRVTPHMQAKIARALNAAAGTEEYTPRSLFNY